MDNLNDIMDQINQPNRQQENESIGNDSNLPSSMSGFGVDEDNPEANAQYIQENQQPQAIINAVGVEFQNPMQQQEDSGVASSVSRTRTSEFIPEITEFEKKDSKYESSSQISEEKADIITNDNYDENEINDAKIDGEDIETEHLSAFDLALSKKMYEQAKIYYDDCESRGLEVPTIHRTQLKDIVPSSEQEQLINEHGEPELLEEEMWNLPFLRQRIKMLKIDFKYYLEKIYENDFKGIRNVIEKKREKNKCEEEILKNIKTKKNRKCKKKETIDLIEEYLQRLKFLKSVHTKLQREERERKLKANVPTDVSSESIQDLQQQAEQSSASCGNTNDPNVDRSHTLAHILHKEEESYVRDEEKQN